MPLVIGLARLLLAWTLVAIGLVVIGRLAESRRVFAGPVPDRGGETVRGIPH